MYTARLVKAGDPGEAGDAKVRARVVEDARVEPPEPDLVPVRRPAQARVTLRPAQAPPFFAWPAVRFIESG